LRSATRPATSRRRAVGIACGAVTWGYAAPSALKALRPDLVFERMADIAPKLIGT
jgi:phosphoglycolate phosphatase